MILIKVATPNRDFQYESNYIPRKGEDISDGFYLYTVQEVCHMLDEYKDSSKSKYLSYILVRAV
jgi:hypothetical protein